MTAKDNHIPKRTSNFDEELDTALWNDHIPIYNLEPNSLI
jgi:hypothetical protein